MIAKKNIRFSYSKRDNSNKTSILRSNSKKGSLSNLLYKSASRPTIQKKKEEEKKETMNKTQPVTPLKGER